MFSCFVLTIFLLLFVFVLFLYNTPFVLMLYFVFDFDLCGIRHITVIPVIWAILHILVISIIKCEYRFILTMRPASFILCQKNGHEVTAKCNIRTLIHAYHRLLLMLLLKERRFAWKVSSVCLFISIIPFLIFVDIVTFG